MERARHVIALVVLMLALNVGTGCAAPFWNLFGFGSSDDSSNDNSNNQQKRPMEGGNRRFIHNHHKSPKPHYSSEQQPDYDTYYVPIHPTGYVEKEKHVYNHAEGVDVWELPSLWDGNIEVPNMLPSSVKAPHSYHGEADSDERVVKGWDNRWGFRLAIPYIGDFQYLREMGPGDFVPKLGPGRFEYPGPGEVDDPGHIGYEQHYKDYKKEPEPPVIDLTHYDGLQNYPWYS